ncbi:MAG: hypothetical protein FWG30_06690 [Eubacteriaceae bacterium]|nr:hypothetical protein [Eubacteriaceae bacterium]
MDNSLLSHLDSLDAQNRHNEIISTILGIPEEERGYGLACRLARAYNNTEQFDAAISELLSVSREGESDCMWHYRLGYALYYSDRFEEALEEFMLAKSKSVADNEWFEAYILWSIAKIQLKSQQ